MYLCMVKQVYHFTNTVLNMEIGKSYHARLSGGIKPVKIHIDHILPSVYNGTRLIVFRYWLKHRPWWHEKMLTEEELLMYIEFAKK